MLMDIAAKLWSRVGPVGRTTNPGLAAVLGFLFGGIGLALYFRTLVDALVPVFITVAFLVLNERTESMGWIFGALVASAYGYFRSSESNQRQGAPSAPAPSSVEVSR